MTLGYNAFTDEVDGINSNDKRVPTVSLGLSGQQLDPWLGGGRLNWSLTPTWGDLDLSGNAQSEQADAASFETAGSFGKVEYSLSRLQSLNHGFSLFLSLSGQAASKNLDSSQKFQAGGPNGVRAYPGGEASSDQGQLAQVELRYDRRLPRDLGNLQIQAFYDTAWVQLYNDPGNEPINTATEDNRYQINGAGVGLSLSKPGRYLVRAIWASKIGGNPGRNSTSGYDSDDQSLSDRIWLQGILWF